MLITKESVLNLKELHCNIVFSTFKPPATTINILTNPLNIIFDDFGI